MEKLETQSVLQHWSNDVILEFIQLYKNEEVIWDPKHVNHKNRSELTAAWDRIQEAMKEIGVYASLDQLKRKKESLMTSFRNKCYKKRQEPDYRTSWFAYPLMHSFLGELYGTNSANDSKSQFQNTSSPDHEYASTEKSRPSTLKRKRISEPTKPETFRTRQIQKVATTSTTPTASKIDDRAEMDECELYCTLLARKLRRLDQRQRDIAMHEIDNIVFRVTMTGNASQRKVQSPSPVFIVTEQSNDYNEENVKYLEDPIDDDED